jgi:hypothetical protein
VPDGAGDNYAPLQAIGWQAHVYGRAADQLRVECATHGLPLHVFSWSEAHGSAGLERDALYLLRPDTYVALAARGADSSTLARYFAERGVRYAPRA